MNSGSAIPVVPTKVRWSYAAPAFALAVVGVPIFVYLPKFYTDIVGLDVTVLGYLILASRVLDALSDPLVGLLSDRSETRWGRRRPFIAAASLPLAVAVWLLFSPPPLSPQGAAWWFGATIFALFLFWTAVDVPYESLGPELTFDYRERTSVLGMRDGFLLIGTLAAVAFPAFLAWGFGLSNDATAERSRFSTMALVYAPMIVLSCCLCAFTVRERPRPESAAAGRGQAASFRSILRNRPFLVLLTAYAVSAFGSNLPAVLILFYVTYVLQGGSPEVFLLLYFVAGILFLPLWIRAAHRFDKKTTWLTGMAINTGAFFAVFFLGPGDVLPYAVLVTLSGIGFGAVVAIPSSMQADVIDYDELLSGQRREGQYIGLWSITRKLAAAVGVGLALPILGAAGYQPNVEQTPQVQLVLRVLYALVPCACSVLAFAVALNYPINGTRHAQIRAGIAAQRDGRSAADPLRP